MLWEYRTTQATPEDEEAIRRTIQGERKDLPVQFFDLKGLQNHRIFENRPNFADLEYEEDSDNGETDVDNHPANDDESDIDSDAWISEEEEPELVSEEGDILSEEEWISPI